MSIGWSECIYGFLIYGFCTQKLSSQGYVFGCKGAIGETNYGNKAAFKVILSILSYI